MKTSIKKGKETLFAILMALLLGLSLPTQLNAHTSKKVTPIKEKKIIDFNIEQFKKYLKDGNPHKVEGIYSSPDQRYVVAIVKNNISKHDFIGVVVKADNEYWKEGEIKFNFVLMNNTLRGFYYNSKGTAYSIDFCLGGDTLQTDCLKKLDLNKINFSF